MPSVLGQPNVLVEHRVSADAVISAQTDAEAIGEWLHARAQSSRHTWDAYSRESYRLLVWLSVEQMQLDDLKVKDVHRFFRLLGNPPEEWIRPRKQRKCITLERTQVLTGPLSADSIAYTRGILGNMFAYLHEGGYLRRNPFRLSARPPVIQRTEVTRYLDLATWRWLRDWIVAMTQETSVERAHAARCRWLFHLLYHSGMRREEVALGRMSDFIWNENAWRLRVIGKGLKERFISANTKLVAELAAYRSTLGLNPRPHPGEHTPLVCSVQRKRVDTLLTPRAIGLIVRTTAARAAACCEDPQMASQLTKMSTHWMRHTNATHRLQAGASLSTTQEELGHADPRTTHIYAKTIDSARRDDAEKLATLS